MKRKLSDLSFPISYFETWFRTQAPVTDWPQQFAIVTGYATTGEQWSDEANESADQSLTDEVKASGRWHHRVTGYSPITGHVEPGWAVEMPFLEACDLGHRYKQDAIYYIDGDILLATHCEPGRRELFQVGPSFRDRLNQGPVVSRPAAGVPDSAALEQ